MTPTSTPAASTAPPSGSALLEEEARQHPYWKSNSYALLVGNLSNTLGFSIFYPYFPLMVREMGVEQNLDSVVGYLAGMYFLVSFLSGPVWGGLADHYGRRSMILRAGFGMGVGFTLSALMPSLTWFVLVFAVVGLANGYVPSGMGLIATNTPRRHLGWALSLAQSGTLIGTTVGPLVGAVLSGLMPTYRDLFFIAGGFSTLAGLVALFWVKERHTRPTEPFRLSILADSRVILRQPGMGVLMVLHTVFNLIYFGSTPVIALFVLSMAGGAPVIDGLRVETWMGLATLALTVASIAAMPLWGRALDRWEPGRVMAIGLGLSALSMLPLLFVHSLLQLTLSRLALGLFAVGLQPALVRITKERAPAGMDSRALALGSSMLMLGSGAAPVLAGLISPLLGLRAFFALSVVLLMLGLAWWIWSGLLRVERVPPPRI